MRFRRLSLNRLIGLGAALLSAATVLSLSSVAVVSTRTWGRMQTETEKVIAEQASAESIVGQMQDQVTLAGYYVRDPRDELAGRFRVRGDQVFVNLRGYLYHDLPPAERTEVEQLKLIHQQFEATAQLVFDLVRRDDREHAALLIDRMVDQSLRLHDEVDRLMALQRNRLDRLKQAQRMARQDMYAALLMVCAAALTAIVLLASVLRRRLLGPLGELSRAAARLGAGDLAARTSRPGQSELAAVADSFNDMADRLQNAQGELETRNSELADTLATLRRTQQEVVQAEKMTALGGMLAGLAHELNNPLASVLGYGEMLRQRLRESPGEPAGAWAAELAEPIVAEALRARDLVRGMLHFSRTAGSGVGAVSLNAALGVVMGLRRYSFAQASLALETEVRPGVWVMGEEQRLQQVLLNLVNNAYDALTGGGGTGLRIAVAEKGGWVEIAVRDDGPGLAEPARVFDPFYTTKPVGKGTGLGLSLVHRMVSDFGGSVDAFNAPGGGACFVLRLRAARVPADLPDEAPTAAATVAAPVSTPAAATAGTAATDAPASIAHPAPVATIVEAPRQAEPVAPETVSQRTVTVRQAAGVVASRADAADGGAQDEADRKPRVLVVDDEEPLRSLQRRILARMGVEVLLAASGSEAEKVLRSEPVDVVVSDVKMPGSMTGVDLYRWVSGELPDLAERFIFITGDVYEPSIADLAESTPDRFLAKPFQADEYMRHVRRVLSMA